MRKWIIAAYRRSRLLAGCTDDADTHDGSAGRGPQRAGATAPSDRRRHDTGARRAAASTGTGRRRRRAAALRDPNNILSKRSIYFDYDSSSSRTSTGRLVEAHAKYLQRNRTRA